MFEDLIGRLFEEYQERRVRKLSVGLSTVISKTTTFVNNEK